MEKERSFKVVQTTDLPSVSGYLKQAFPKLNIDYKMQFCASADEIIAAARDADILALVPPDQPLPRRVIESLPKLRYILGLVSGYDSIDIKAATERGILVTYMPDLFYEEVADHTMALVLACARKIVELNDLVKKGEWVNDRLGSRLGRELWPKLTRLQGQTLGIIGLGHIGHSVAVKAKGFAMRIIAADPFVPQSVFDELGIEKVEMDQLLRESDFVAVLTTLSDKTRGLIGVAELRKMKPSAYIVNAARGPIINRDALYTALSQKWIEGAGLDVTEPEPSTPENNPLVNLPNVIMTAHSAGQDKVAFGNLARLVPQQVLRVMRGELPNNLLNPEVKEKYRQRWGK